MKLVHRPRSVSIAVLLLTLVAAGILASCSSLKPLTASELDTIHGFETTSQTK